jgi:hypothetical protein
VVIKQVMGHLQRWEWRGWDLDRKNLWLSKIRNHLRAGLENRSGVLSHSVSCLIPAPI